MGKLGTTKVAGHALIQMKNLYTYILLHKELWYAYGILIFVVRGKRISIPLMMLCVVTENGPP